MAQQILKEQKLKFTKGETYHLDAVYMLQGLLPEMDVYWEQDDALKDHTMGGDCGESIRILKNFTISYKVVG